MRVNITRPCALQIKNQVIIRKFANSIKSLVDQKLKEGNSEKEIYEYLKVRYGDWILYDPEFSKNTYFLWLLPLLLFLFGGAIILKLFNIRKN